MFSLFYFVIFPSFFLEKLNSYGFVLLTFVVYLLYRQAINRHDKRQLVTVNGELLPANTFWQTIIFQNKQFQGFQDRYSIALSRAKRTQRSTMGKKIQLSTYPRKFGYDVSVLRPSVHSLGVREGNHAGVPPSRGGVCYIFFAGNRAMNLCNPRFFLAGNRARSGVTIVVTLKNFFILGTCF